MPIRYGYGTIWKHLDIVDDDRQHCVTGVNAMVMVRPSRRVPVPDGTSQEDLAIFLAGWRRYQKWAVREESAAYDACLQPLLARLEEHLDVLRELAGLSVEEFLADPRLAGAAQYRLFLAWAAVIDSTKWLEGKVRLHGRPRSIAEAFDRLVGAGVLPAAKRNVYVGLARLWNWIMHEAVSLPPAKVHALLRFYLPELEAHAALLRRR